MIGWHRISHRKEHLALGALLCIVLFLVVSHRYGYDNIKFNFRESETTPAADAQTLQSRYVDFWDEFYSLIISNDPLCEKKPQLDSLQGSISYKPDQDLPRPDLARLDAADISRLKSAHSNFVKDIQSTKLAKLVYHPNTRGIVVTASDHSLATLTISITMLRNTGSTLPVEVFLDKPSQYTQDYCSGILSPLNAHCRYLSDIFIASGAIIQPHTYQYKILAIIFSSFEEILFLDYDAFPIQRPESLFDSLPFEITGMVLWPDFWFPSESPYFFDIANITPIPHLNDRASTESGIILYNKAKHNLSILLATYYNFYGPDYYYHLHSQGAPGEGDKETFGLAALALGEDFYTVRQGVSAVGRFDSSGEFVGVAMAQHDPIQDFSNTNTTVQQARLSRTPYVAPTEEEEERYVTPKPFFVHANFPKINPYTIFDTLDERGLHKPVQDSNGTWVRGWMPRAEAIGKFGTDLEESLWKVVRSVTCETLRGVGLPTDIHDQTGRAEIDQRDQRVCAMMDEFFDYVYESGR